MFVERKYFRWNDEYNLPDIRLGDNVEELVRANVVSIKLENAEKLYYLTSDPDVRVGVENDTVDRVFFVQGKGNALLKIDPYSFEYPATDAITTYLSKTFEVIPFAGTTKEFVEAASGDYLIIIFRDFIPTNVFIKRYE